MTCSNVIDHFDGNFFFKVIQKYNIDNLVGGILVKRAYSEQKHLVPTTKRLWRRNSVNENKMIRYIVYLSCKTWVVIYFVGVRVIWSLLKKKKIKSEK